MISSQRRRRQRPHRRRIVWALALALAFAVGIAFGQALDDNPKPGSTTQERTFTILPESSTVTVTTP